MISKTIAHHAMVSEDDFIAAQAVNATPTPADGATREYALVGLVACRVCGLRMDSHWVHGRPGYCCRHGHTSAKPATTDRPKTLYLREDQILAHIGANLKDSDPLEPAALIDYLRGSGHHNRVRRKCVHPRQHQYNQPATATVNQLTISRETTRAISWG